MKNTKNHNSLFEKKNSGFKPFRLSWKVLAVILVVLCIITILLSYMTAWRIIKAPLNQTYRANELLINGKIKESLEMFEKAIETNPGLTMAWTGRGLCLIYLHRFKEALNSYDKALSLNPKLLLAWQGKGLSHENLGQFDDAMSCYAKGLAIFPNNSNLLNLKDKLTVRMGEHTQ